MAPKQNSIPFHRLGETKDAVGNYRELDEWVEGWEPREHPDAVFYIAGYIPAVVRLRRLLRRKGVAGRQIQAQGFWD